jgi:formate-dependent nitrite reductase membrane component NrfD
VIDTQAAQSHWGGAIVWVLYLGGIAAGAYAVAALAALLGGKTGRRATRPAHYIAFPLVCFCGVLLTTAPGGPGPSRPGAFRRAPVGWSAAPAGPRGLTAFGAFCAVSFFAALVEDGWLGSGPWRGRLVALRRAWPGKLFAAAGACAALVVGSSTGVLLPGPAPPGWAGTPWLGALFLGSAASTGAAALVVLARWRCPDVSDEQVEGLERADGGAILLELAALVAFSLSLRGASGLAFMRWPGMLIPLFVVPVGLVLPLILRQVRGVQGAVDSALLVLLGGYVLRVAVVGMPASLALR